MRNIDLIGLVGRCCEGASERAESHSYLQPYRRAAVCSLAQTLASHRAPILSVRWRCSSAINEDRVKLFCHCGNESQYHQRFEQLSCEGRIHKGCATCELRL